MKLKFRHIACILVLSALFSTQGCVFDMDTCEDFPENTVGYLAIKLQPSDGMTRALGDEFDFGKADEFALSPGEHHFAIFYNDGQVAPLAVAKLSGLVERESNSTVAFAAIASKSEQKNLLERLQECFIILNAELNDNELWTMPKDRLLETVVNAPVCRDSYGNEYFTMCNSVYIDGGKTVSAAEVDTDFIYTSYLEAMEEAWKGNAAVVANVERIVAKLSVRFENESFNDAATEKVFIPDNSSINFLSHIENDIPYYDGSVSSRIKITGWGLNGLERESYLFRNFDVNGNYFSGWYSSDRNRAFWSEDPHYGAEVYPWQFRKAIDNKDIPYYNGNENILRNLSFKELENNGFGKNNSRYAPENTYDFTDTRLKNQLDSRPELLAGTHIIICAELQTDRKVRNVFETEDLYRDRNGNFYGSESDCVAALISLLNNNIMSHSFLKFQYYDWTNGGNEQILFAKTSGDYGLYYNDAPLTSDNIGMIAGSLTADATVREGDGKRLLWIDGLSIRNGNGEALQIYTNIDEVDSSKDVYLRTATVDDIKSLLLQYTGTIDHFKDGKMYYAVPIGFVKDNSASSEDQDRYSIYGVVRNCVYDIVIHGATGPGTSVDNDEEPIVPNKISTHDNLYLSFDILGWHETDQNVPGVIS